MEKGETGDQRQRSAVSPAVARVVGLVRDQNERLWAEIQQGAQRGFLPTSLFMKPSEASDWLVQQGINVFTASEVSRLANEATTQVQIRKTLVATTFGWCGPALIYGDGTAILPKGCTTEIIIQVKPDPRYDATCTASEYWDPLIPVIKDQLWPIFSLGGSFASPLLGVMSKTEYLADNIFFNFCGDSSIGKTSIFIKLMGSTMGGGPGREGFGRPLKGTRKGISAEMHRNNTFAQPWDEVNLIEGPPKQQAQFLRELLF